MRTFLGIITLFFSITALAQPKTDYYTSNILDGKNGRELELALKTIVYPHTRIRYDDLWSQYPVTDLAPLDSIPSTYEGEQTDLVWDMYAWISQFPKFYSDNDHSQTGGFNREHAVPNSWWGGKAGNTYAYSDLHHLMPADGCANSVAKNDYPIGEYEEGMILGWPKEDKANSNGYVYVRKEGSASHRWDISNDKRENYGGATSIFEPSDTYKGDFARMYLYVICAYEGDLTWQTNYMFENDEDNFTNIKPWARDILLRWHRQDPVSDKERNRNNAVEGIQQNRNPFIDYPELVEYIWGDRSEESFTLADAICSYSEEYLNGGKKNSEIMLVIHTALCEEFNGITFTTSSDGIASYNSSNTDVATVDPTTGEVTINAVGETIITYSVEETETYESSVEEYVIVVEE